MNTSTGGKPERRLIADVFSRDDTLRPVFTHANKLLTLQRGLRAVHLHPLVEHLTVANVQRETLVLNADSPAWATRARFMAEPLLAALLTHCPDEKITEIKVRVAPKECSESQPAETDRLRPSKYASDHLRNTAQLIEDKSLSASLNRLAETLDRVRERA